MGRGKRNCAKSLVAAGVKRINFMGEYQNSRGKEYIEQLAVDSQIELVHYDVDPIILLTRALDILQGPGGALKAKGVELVTS